MLFSICDWLNARCDTPGCMKNQLYIYWKKSTVCGSMQFKPMFFKGQLYCIWLSCLLVLFYCKAGLPLPLCQWFNEWISSFFPLSVPHSGFVCLLPHSPRGYVFHSFTQQMCYQEQSMSQNSRKYSGYNSEYNYRQP